MAALGAFVLLTSWPASTLAECTESTLLAPGQPLPTGPNPHFTVVADFNEDGKPDLAVTNADLPHQGNSASSVAILLGIGAGSFTPAITYAVDREPHGMVAVDVNEDGILDLVTANKYGGTVSVLRGLGAGGVGNGTFAPASNFTTGGYAFHLVAGDFDEDGITDLAVSLNSVAAVAVLRGLGAGGVGDGTFATPVLFGLWSLSTGLESGDFNEDGILDLVATEYGTGTVAVLLGQGTAGVGDGTFAAASHYAAGPQPFDVAVADLTGDGILDLAVANADGGGTRLLLGNGIAGQGDGTFSSGTTLLSGNSVAVVALDANDDGIPDLAVGDFVGNGTGFTRLFLGNGNGTFGSMTAYAIGADPYMLTVADVDQDGYEDLVAAAALLNYVTVLHGGCPPSPPDPRRPVLTDVRDVPNDQGGKVFVTWLPSSLDVTGGSVSNYRVWRRIPELAALPRLARGDAEVRRLELPRVADARAVETTYWEPLVTLPAQRREGYGYTAATTQDSMPGSNPYTAFLVSALTSNIDVFFDSRPDSGYSVDNLRPLPPQGVVAFIGPSEMTISWRLGDESDLAGYEVHRGPHSGFVPSPETRIASVSDTQYVDAWAAPSFYKVVAVDVHGNPSAPTLASFIGPTAVLVSTFAPVLADGRVDLGWQLATPTPAEIQRRKSGGEWSVLGIASPEIDGVVRWTDATVRPGVTYDYRLRLAGDHAWQTAGEVQVTVPAMQLSLDRVRPNPLTGGAFMVRFALDATSSARLEVLDVAGRRVHSTDVAPLGPGWHTVDLDRDGRLSNGVYLVRLASGAREILTRAVIIR